MNTNRASNSPPETSERLTVEEAKNEEAELKASFKASLRASLHSKTGSSIARIVSDTPDLVNFKDEVLQRVDGLGERIGLLEQANNYTIRDLKAQLAVSQEKFTWLEKQMPEKKAEAQMKKDNEIKEQILKKRGSILQVLDLSRLTDQAGANKDAQLQRRPSPPIDSQINEMFKNGIQRHVPLKWDISSECKVHSFDLHVDPQTKKWIGPDQVCVEDAFMMHGGDPAHLHTFNSSPTSAMNLYSSSTKSGLRN